MVKTIFLILTLFFVPASFAHAIKQPVKAALVTDTSSLKHEKKLRLGVLFTMDPGWHIYWKNSGDSGVPTKVEFNLPKGFERVAASATRC